MGDGTFRGRWVDEVFRCPLITDAARVALLAMAMDMDEAGHVSVPREDLAARIGKGKARITERLQAAVDAGLLERTVAGKRGQVAEYVARLPKGSAYPDPNAEPEDLRKGPRIRTESEHFGSGLQTQSSPFGSGLQTQTAPSNPGLGPDSRTSTPEKGSAYPDPLCSSGVKESDDLKVVEDEGSLFGVEPAAPRQPSKKPRAKQSSTPKTTVPEDFAVTDEMRQWARQRTPLVDIDLQTERFVNHFIDKGTKRPGWLRSWNNWMLQQQSWATERGENVRQLRPTGTDGKYAPGSGSQVPDRNDYNARTFV